MFRPCYYYYYYYYYYYCTVLQHQYYLSVCQSVSLSLSLSYHIIPMHVCVYVCVSDFCRVCTCQRNERLLECRNGVDPVPEFENSWYEKVDFFGKSGDCDGIQENFPQSVIVRCRQEMTETVTTATDVMTTMATTEASEEEEEARKVVGIAMGIVSAIIVCLFILGLLKRWRTKRRLQAELFRRRRSQEEEEKRSEMGAELEPEPEQEQELEAETEAGEETETETEAETEAETATAAAASSLEEPRNLPNPLIPNVSPLTTSRITDPQMSVPKTVRIQIEQ